MDHHNSYPGDFTPSSSTIPGLPSSAGSSKYAESQISRSTTVKPGQSLSGIGGGGGGGEGESRKGLGRNRQSSAAMSLSSEGNYVSSSGGGASQGGKGKEKDVFVRRPEEMLSVVKDRLFSWAYMEKWYEGSVCLLPHSCQHPHLQL